ncbi:hypothetical protein BDZ97DRAFT_2059492 [Flammula alnicola]|nr:hypothetical protein BDZ97DRAFT_2059492 [Flammula alnicola]
MTRAKAYRTRSHSLDMANLEGVDKTRRAGVLLEAQRWAQYQPLLLHRGYQLRPRYHPDWQPTWQKKGERVERKGKYEDSLSPFWSKVMDAVRIRDGLKVAIKWTEDIDTQEIPILLYLNSPEMLADPRNATVPLLDVIILPDKAFIVMPLLIRFNALPFRHLGEFSEVVEQLLSGCMLLQYHDGSTKVIPKASILLSGKRVTASSERSLERTLVVQPVKYYSSTAGLPFAFHIRLLVQSGCFTIQALLVKIGYLSTGKCPHQSGEKL